MNWRKSSYSGNTEGGGECVELAYLSNALLVRDSKNPDGPRLSFSPDSMAALIEAAVNNRLS